jgi:threonine synthase
MRYYSTNQRAPGVSFREAVLNGLAPDGGLYLPGEIPPLPAECSQYGRGLNYHEVAFHLARPFIDNEIDDLSLLEICKDAFNFPVKLTRIAGGIHALELFWGPTFAFKDFGARFLARVLNYFAVREQRRMTILVATSGDTGSAVAHGFAGMDAIDVVLLYPSGRVSPMQEKQLTTLTGNVAALEVKGTFDDCQAMAKTAFADPDIRTRRPLNSANSINIGRLIPQSFYYIYAYGLLDITPGTPVYICVPSGNFGNVTGTIIARFMGLPVPRIVVGTNMNDVVPRYLETGNYTSRAAGQTPASAMDVGNPSNFSRILQLFNGSHRRITEVLRGYGYSSPRILETIKRVKSEHGYLLDPHSAVGYAALRSYLEEINRLDAVGFFAATAHPGKFSEAIFEATGKEIDIPPQLLQALQKEKHSIVINNRYDELKAYLSDTL